MMMAFMLLLGSVDVSAFAAQNETDEAQTVSVQPEEDSNNAVEPKLDDSALVEESKEDSKGTFKNKNDVSNIVCESTV